MLSLVPILHHPRELLAPVSWFPVPHPYMSLTSMDNFTLLENGGQVVLECALSYPLIFPPILT